MHFIKNILSVTCLIISTGLTSTSHATDVTGSLRAKLAIGEACILHDGAVLDFGHTDDLSKDITAETPILDGIIVRCNKGIAFKVGLDNGTNPTGGDAPFQRQMTNGNTKLPYGLYQDAERTKPWPDVDDDNVPQGIGTSFLQEFSVFGTLPKMDTTPSSSDYTDTVKVTLRF